LIVRLMRPRPSASRAPPSPRRDSPTRTSSLKSSALSSCWRSRSNLDRAIGSVGTCTA